MIERERNKNKIDVGSEVPILQHNCRPGSLGQIGILRETNQNGIPTTASCKICHKTVAVDIRTLRKQGKI